MLAGKPRVLILDPDFEHDGGHNSVANHVLLGRLNCDVRLVCPVTLPASVTVRGADLHRSFPRNSYIEEEMSGTGLARLFSRLRGSRAVGGRIGDVRQAFAAVVFDHLQGMEATSQDSILIHTGSSVLFEAVLQALERWPANRWPSLHLRQLRPVTGIGTAALLHQRLRDCRQLTGVYLYAETDAFAGQLVQLGHQPRDIDKLEMSDIACPVTPPPAVRDVVRIAVLGTVRREKGYGQLAAIGRHYQKLSQRRSLPQLRFDLHTGAVRNGRLYRRLLKDLDRSAIEYSVSSSPASAAGHWQTLTESHIVLAPYEAGPYTNRGSGVCIDAIAHGRPLVVTAGCTLEEYLRGGNGLSARHAAEFAQSIAAIAENHATYAEAALRLAESFRSRQQAHPIFDRLDV